MNEPRQAGAKAAFFIATVSMKDPAKFQEYGQKAAATFTRYGGEVIIRGGFVETLAGASPNHQAVGIVKFPNVDALREWYRSPEYQSLIALRDEASNMTIAVYEAP